MISGAVRLASRQFSSSAIKNAGELPAGYAALKQRQKMFNLDNGLRIHERGGKVDWVMYNMTLGCIFVGGIMWVKTVYQMAYPPRN